MSHRITSLRALVLGGERMAADLPTDLKVRESTEHLRKIRAWVGVN